MDSSAPWEAIQHRWPPAAPPGAQSNNCEYCLSAHACGAEHALHLSADEIAAARMGTSADLKANAVFALALAVNEKRGAAEEDVAAAHAAGLSDKEIAEVVANVALSVFHQLLQQHQRHGRRLPDRDAVTLLPPNEPTPIRLMNTVWCVRARRHDGLATVGELAAWLDAVVQQGEDAAPGAADLERFRALRNALRRLGGHVTGADPATGAAVGGAALAVNQAAGLAPTRFELALRVVRCPLGR